MARKGAKDLLSAVLVHLSRVTGPDRQDWYTALCPLHDDRNHPNLRVRERGFKCMACGEKGGLKALAVRLGIATPPGQPKRGKRQSRTTKTRYEVRYPEGNLVAVHVREDRPEKKILWWELPDGTKNLGGRPLWSLPLYGSQHLAGLPEGAPVIICEGEKAADALRSIGVDAVGTVTGADGTPGEEALRPLLHLCPVLWSDADPPGERHMERIAVRLTALGCNSPRRVEWSDAPQRGDAADAVAQGIDVRQLIADARPWQGGTVDLDALLDDVVSFVRRYVVVGEHELVTLALWVAHTYAIDAAECTPYLRVTSAEKRCGKTRLLETLAPLVARPWLTARVTAAVLVRKVARDCPTMLLDESDAAFKGDKEYAETLRAILNSGYRRGGVVSLCVKQGSDFDLRDFPVFGPKGLAGIGKLPDTVTDRSIPIELRRKLPGEPTERLRVREAQQDATPLRERLERWAAMATIALEGPGRISLRAGRPGSRGLGAPAGHR